MKKFIKTFDVCDTQVAVIKDMLINQQRNKFTFLVRVCTPFPHPEDKQIFFEQLYADAIECSDAADQEIKFQKYDIEDAARFAGQVKENYNKIVSKESGQLIMPGDLNFKLPFTS